MTKSKYPKLSRLTLRAKYDCYGHFYTLKITSKEKIKCRSVLEIVDNKFSGDPKELSINLPDAIFIMMNPGASEPDLTKLKKISETSISLAEFGIDFVEKELVLTVPDDTQDKIMNVMNVLGWNHVRILNLSDIREKASQLLYTHLRKLNGPVSTKMHSLFAEVRLKERKCAFGLNRKSHCSIPIIAGWGTLGCLSQIATKANADITAITKGKLYGIHKCDSYYYHPSRKKNWHDDIIDQVKNTQM